MNITIKTKNIELTEALESFINKKIGGLKKFFSSFENHRLPMAEGRSLFDTFVEIGKENNHHRKCDVFMAEAKIYMPGKSIFAKTHGEDMIKIINELRDEMESEIRRYKSKVIEFPRRRAKQKKQEI